MRALVLIVFTFFVNSATATTYYADSASGNDAWSGKIASPNGSPGTDGPWATLTKVSAASLLPGDAVLLKCGQSWNQTLSIKKSGTASITYGVYPTPCATAPQITGSTVIPASNWKQYSGNIYRATLPLDLISNSTFDAGVSGWTQSSQFNDAILSLTSSCQSGSGNCLSFTGGTGTSTSVVTSNSFGLNAGMAYKLNVAVKIPSGKTIWAIVRRAVPPLDQLGLQVSISGNGAWQTLSFPFTATASLADARLDFQVPAGVSIGLDNVRVESAVTGVYGVFDSGAAVNIAHHPNRGYDPNHPGSIYYAIAQNSAQTVIGGNTVSTYLTTGTDLQLPSGATLTPGTGIRIRSNNYSIEERKIASVSGSTINLDQPTNPLYKDWGYFLTGQLWMLDEPGESFYDAVSNSVYVWMADSQAPGDRVSIGQVDAGIDISNVSNVIVDGIAVRNTQTGIRVKQANTLALRNLDVEDILGMGVDATQSANVQIGMSRFARTGKAAISGADGGYGLNGFLIYNNDIAESGVKLNGSVVTSLPTTITAAVQPGTGAIVVVNRLRSAAYAGIMTHANSFVVSNDVENACLVLDDGGAIYVQGQNNNSGIYNNTVVHVIGARDGKPATGVTLAQGIYLDDLTTGVTVSGNTVVDAYDGIHVHNAASNQILNNTFYGNRRYQIWFQENNSAVRAADGTFGNVVKGNRFFPTGTETAIRQDTILSSTAGIASYDQNLYFTLLSPPIASESWSTGTSATYTFPQWQSATTSNGAPRNLDSLGSQVNSGTIGYATYKVTGSTNSVPNGNLASGSLNGWSAWNETAPYGQMSVVTCKPGKCLRYAAGASVSLLSSPNFSVVQGRWYRVSFDLQGSAANQTFYALVRRGGGGSNGYEGLMTTPLGIFTASTGFQRYSFAFQATQTVNAGDPVTKDKGARIDFQGIQPGQTVTVTDVEMLPISPIEASLRTNILVNPTNVQTSFDCPFSGTDASFCNQMVRFTDAQPVYWPYAVGANNSEIIYSRDSTLIDADGDGIPDTQDLCAFTPAGQGVNAKGCSFSQSYP